jgi:hypothetical protein
MDKSIKSLPGESVAANAVKKKQRIIHNFEDLDI